MFFTFKEMSAAIINRKWITPKEIWGVTHLLVLSVGLSEYLPVFRLLTERLVSLWQKSGKKFLVQYLKESVACVIAFLNHSVRISPQGAPRVKRSRAGLPTIIPGPLRFVILRFRAEGAMKDQLLTRIVLTVLSVYRVINFVAVPNFGTVTDPFNGVSPLLALGELVKVMALFPKARVGSVTWLVSESSGPNGPRATWFSGADALAWLEHPKIFFGSLIPFMIRSGFYAALGWILLIQVISFPGIVVLVLLKGLKVIPSKLGRLAVLNVDGAGKRRIVAITDFWTQLVFKPYHDAIFHILRSIEQDGTFDQWAPIERWVLPRVRLGFPAFSFDLTAATDRLPVAFQGQVFSLLLEREYLPYG
jgi:hypothetical protein